MLPHTFNSNFYIIPTHYNAPQLQPPTLTALSSDSYRNTYVALDNLIDKRLREHLRRYEEDNGEHFECNHHKCRSICKCKTYLNENSRKNFDNDYFSRDENLQTFERELSFMKQPLNEMFSQDENVLNGSQLEWYNYEIEMPQKCRKLSLTQNYEIAKPESKPKLRSIARPITAEPSYDEQTESFPDDKYRPSSATLYKPASIPVLKYETDKPLKDKISSAKLKYKKTPDIENKNNKGLVFREDRIKYPWRFTGRNDFTNTKAAHGKLVIEANKKISKPKVAFKPVQYKSQPTYLVYRGKTSASFTELPQTTLLLKERHFCIL